MCLISSVALARTRDALFNTWDKNDPKDAQVILHLMKTGVTQTYRDPILEETNDILELSRTHFQVSLLKTRVQHSILTHFLPLYFPEMDKLLHTEQGAVVYTTLLGVSLSICHYVLYMGSISNGSMGCHRSKSK